MTIPITGHTSFTGLLGHPVAHSISPAMHNESFQQLGIDCIYLCFDVTEDNLADAVKGLQIAGIQGFNLTMPCKNKIISLCDVLSPAASLAQAVNTVVIRDGLLYGHNTDGIGFWKAAQEAGFSHAHSSVTLMGIGGAATAIAVQAALDGVDKLQIFARPSSRFWERACRMIERLQAETSCHVQLYDQSDTAALGTAISTSDLLINATSVGMAPHCDETILPDTSMLHPALTVADVIYNPRETLFLHTAKEAGCKTFNGMYMLLYQGAEAFHLWTGQEMPVGLIKEKYFSL